MESSTVAEQRATAVAKLKRAASLPRMKDGRRPPMHTEAVSEGERTQNDESPDGERVQEPEEKPISRMEVDAVEATEEGKQSEDGNPQDPPAEPSIVKDLDSAEAPPPPDRPSTPSRRRRRARSRGSKDLRTNKPQRPTINTGESSADEGNPPAVGEDAPPSPPVVSPIPSHFATLTANRLLRSPMSPIPPLFYPGTNPSTPLPTLDDLSRGLFRSNSAGAARAMAMSKLVGGKEPVDMSFISQSPTPLTRNNTVAGGERIEARRNLLNRLGGRLNNTDGEITSGGEESNARAVTPISKRRRRRSHRSSSRVSAVLDDRDDREQTPGSPHYTPEVPSIPLPQEPHQHSEPPWQSQNHSDDAFELEPPMGGRGVLIEDDDLPPKSLGLPVTPVRPRKRLPHASDAPSSISTESNTNTGLSIPIFMSKSTNQRDTFPASPFATPLKERPFSDGEDEEEVQAYEELRSKSVSRNAFERDSEISWVAEPGGCFVLTCYPAVTHLINYSTANAYS